MSESSTQHVSWPLSLEIDSITTALTVMTHINAACNPFSYESWLPLCNIEACRNANKTRHKFAICEACGSGNRIVRRAGDHAVRVLGRMTTTSQWTTSHRSRWAEALLLQAVEGQGTGPGRSARLGPPAEAQPSGSD
jgi:hypothetical protein